MSAHPVLSEHPRVVDLDQAVDELLEAERASKERIARLVEPYHEQLAAWERDADQAILAGEDPASKPEPPDLGRDEQAAHLFVQRRSQLQAQRRETLADICREVENAAVARERKLLADARTLVDELETIAAEHDQLLQAVREVRTAADSTGDEQVRPSRSARMRARVDVPAVVELVETGGSAFDLPPTPGLPLPVGGDEPEPSTPEPMSSRGVTL